MNTRIDVHIDELVLHGFAAHDRDAIAEAIRAEIGRALLEPGAADALVRARDAARIDAGSFRRADRERPASIGTKVARSLVLGLSGGSRPVGRREGSGV